MKIRKASETRAKLRMLVYGPQFSGKSTYAGFIAGLKRSDGTDFRVFYVDTETGSIDNYVKNLAADGINPENVMIASTQSLAEVQDVIRTITNNDDFEDDDGNVILDGYGLPFRADALVIDSASVLKMTAQQGLISFSQRRARFRANLSGATGEEKFVKVEGAGMEQKDWGTLNFKGQSLILDLNASGVNYIVICREKDEKENKIVDGKSVSIATGRKLPDGFTGQEYNVDTVIRMYRNNDEYKTVHAFFEKDRTGVHEAGDDVEDPTIFEYQDLLNATAKNKNVVIKNGLNDAVKTEVKLNARDLGLDEEDVSDETPTETSSESGELTINDIKAKLNDLIASASPVKKSAAQKAVKAAGLSTAFRSMTDIEELKKVAAIMEKELA
jgi:hypothetical protein